MKTNTNREASRLRADGRVELTGATDEDGILVDLSLYDIQRMGRQAVEEYQEKRNRQIAEKKAKKADEERFEQYKERFVAEGGNAADARSAYAAMKQTRAAEAADRADQEALRQSRARVRSQL